MKLTLRVYVAILSAVTFCLLFWKNTWSYPAKSKLWRTVKSAIDLSLLLLTTFKLPALLVAWCVVWFTRPIKRPALKTTVAVISGIGFGLAGQWMIDALFLVGIFAVDLLTGNQGFLQDLEDVKKEDADNETKDLQVAS